MTPEQAGLPLDDPAPVSIYDTTPQGMAALCRSRGVRHLAEFESYVRGRLGAEACRPLRDSGALRAAWGGDFDAQVFY